MLRKERVHNYALFYNFERKEEMLVKDLEELRFVDIRESKIGFSVYSFDNYICSFSKDDFTTKEIDLDFMNTLLSQTYTDGYNDALASDLY